MTDEQGVPLPGAAVEAAGPALQGTAAAVTDGQGRYRLSLIPPGTYVLTFTLQGFARETQNGVAVGLGKDTSLNANLHISTRAEMTVTSEAAAITFTSTAVGTNLDNRAVDDAADRTELLVDRAGRPGRLLRREPAEHGPDHDHRLRLVRRRELVLHRRRRTRRASSTASRARS